ncbi:Nuclear transcription factor Y subunit A-1 like [Actinidia chinensis var. chinensis]|uniref:Nuclear transcription factor Y subunit n=1 Tax=Actinidia chinensis var. chinensis TaxID=1590841 RepID=A0A2R6RA71_ACTCC|nr:Nuclear transcription factor Y subunit A-1 like [Actinidia chinensis var. chinensis]
MPTKSKTEDQQAENGAHIIPPSAVYAQPWWRGIGNNAMSSPVGHINGTAAMGTIPSQANGDGSNKETHTATAQQSELSGHNVQEQQHIKHIPSSTPLAIGEHLEPNSQMELVGHSIVLTPYPYAEPHYGEIMAYGAQVHPHLLGIHQTRMPLPLEMEEEPVYVNAKQYNGILRRRQRRAKLEMEKKVIKVRKPYLHESRHQHAMRRARGCGGRFLNTKIDNNSTNPTSEKEPKSGTTVSTQSGNSSSSEYWPSNSNGNSDQYRHISHASSHGNINGHGLSSMHHFRSIDGDGVDWFDQEKGNVFVNQAPRGATTTK